MIKIRKSDLPTLVALLCILVIVTVGVCIWLIPRNGGKNDGGGDKNNGTETVDNGGDSGNGSGGGDNGGGKNNDAEIIQNGDLSVHFLELGNKYTGDSVYIKSGDVDILIDAGSKNSSAPAIISYLDGYIEDGILEYVVATHAHEDHIAGFFSSGSGAKRIAGIFETYEVKTIIDFPRTESASKTYQNYVAARDEEVAAGARHYTALDCFKNQNGASRKYEIGDGIELEILYNYYYDHDASNENDYSVVVMINYGENRYLFTGDLEKSGEDKLVDYYAQNFGGLKKCVLYKGGHHGSSTSSNEKLLSAIRPEYVCICTCAGSGEYTETVPNQFPTQAFIDRISLYTAKVYVTTLVTDYPSNKFEPMNGNIVFLAVNGAFSVVCGNNDTPLKDTDWFLQYRITPPAWK
ncbi:MAG: MBL fold metallo-hydrolase [Clostridiales bacterium]|jgi:competence protein ComEC|nr:MBL fold metallo-hydrolase [Clostridiales bacterium]